MINYIERNLLDILPDFPFFHISYKQFRIQNSNYPILMMIFENHARFPYLACFLPRVSISEYDYGNGIPSIRKNIVLYV